MNTSFKILWFEDDPYWFRMESLRVASILNTHYLTPDITRKDGDDFHIDEVTTNDYDLILMDYKLADKATGDTIVAALRNSDILTDVLFYSSQEQDMLNAIRTQMPPIDGVYLTKRDYTIFTDKVEKVIQKIVRRSEDIVNLRGFVLDNTSGFEVRIKEILNICWQQFDSAQRDCLYDKLASLLESKKSRMTKQIETAKAAECTFSYVNNDHYILGIADRLEILQVILPILSTKYQMPDSICPVDFKQYYIDSVNVYRNKLGHIALSERKIHIKGKDTEIDQDMHRLLRKNISEMDATISKIETFITTEI